MICTRADALYCTVLYCKVFLFAFLLTCDVLVFVQKLLGQFDFGNDSDRSEDSKKDTSSQL